MPISAPAIDVVNATRLIMSFFFQRAGSSQHALEIRFVHHIGVHQRYVQTPVEQRVPPLRRLPLRGLIAAQLITDVAAAHELVVIVNWRRAGNDHPFLVSRHPPQRRRYDRHVEGGQELHDPAGLATLPSAVDIVSVFPRGLPQSAETTIICHNMHLTQDPQVETTNRASYHQKPASAAVRRRRGASRWFAARRTPLTQLTRRTRFLLEASTKPVRDSHACDNIPNAIVLHAQIKCSTIFNTITRQQHLSAETRDVSRANTNNGPCQHKGDMGGGEDRNRHA